MKPNRYGISRPSNTRNPLPVVVLVCDDKRTAVAYFSLLKHQVKAKLYLEVVKAPCHGATPDGVVDVAMNKAKQLADESSSDDGSGDAVWALIDLEIEPKTQTQAQNAKTKAGKAGVCVALSNPCFEVWTLAHLVDTGEAFQNCGAVVTRVKAEWKKQFGTDFGNKKAQADYSKLMPLRETAMERCKRREQNDPSWTEVYKIVEFIAALCHEKLT